MLILKISFVCHLVTDVTFVVRYSYVGDMAHIYHILTWSGVIIFMILSVMYDSNLTLAYVLYVLCM